MYEMLVQDFRQSEVLPSPSSSWWGRGRGLQVVLTYKLLMNALHSIYKADRLSMAVIIRKEPFTEQCALRH